MGPALWAKTTRDGSPGISVLDHCVNVGCVTEAILEMLPKSVQELLPGENGSAAPLLAALHDVGKITLGFQAKCPSWQPPEEFDHQTLKEIPYSVSDHALVSQVFVQRLLKPRNAILWAAAVGAHHGFPKGKRAKLPECGEVAESWAEERRLETTKKLEEIFGLLPACPPNPRFGIVYSDLWAFAGLITVADWIGSNECFFSPISGIPREESRQKARRALECIDWPGSPLRETDFGEAFASESSSQFVPNAVQSAVTNCKAGLVIVEAPMGAGKTEAALHLAQRWISGNHAHGLYFALPTQVTSNRVHLRVGRFLRNTIDGTANLRLAHGNAWLEGDFNVALRASISNGPNNDERFDLDMREGRSWFASSKRALLAPYGVGTIDQALQGLVTVKHFFVRRFALAGKVVILDEIHSYDVYTGTLVGALIRELMNLQCSVIVLSATLTAARRRELLAAAGCEERETPQDYPLVTAARPEGGIHHIRPEWSATKHVRIYADAITEEAAISELIQRAESGQHTLWIRNTVVEAQGALKALRGSMQESDVKVGLLHSRYPFDRREELESDWLERLGTNRPSGGAGSILIATQVVEQSVDIDLDFIVSDLAPTDMLLQRMGRLWRHEREERAAPEPEFWIRLPRLQPDISAVEIKRLLGRSSRVYAPYVLARSAAIWNERREIYLPNDIRSVLEMTYAESNDDETPSMCELREELEKEKRKLQENANAAMRVFGRPMLSTDDDQALTRRKGPPTTTTLLLRSCEQLPNYEWRLTGLDGATVVASEHEWDIAAVRFIHRRSVRIPKWQTPVETQTPRWLELHAASDSTYACIADNGRLWFGDFESDSNYHPDIGVFAETISSTKRKTEIYCDDDDEFDY